MEKAAGNAGKRQYERLIIALAVLAAMAASLILYASGPLITGKTAVLATRPVDPFDILRGQYITINYEISQIERISEAQEGDTVYVFLKEGTDKIHRYAGASLEPEKGQFFIRGRITAVYGSTMQTEYGIEQYYFERNAELPNTNLTVEVKIAGSGDARISNLLHNGKPVEIGYRNFSLRS